MALGVFSEFSSRTILEEKNGEDIVRNCEPLSQICDAKKLRGAERPAIATLRSAFLEFIHAVEKRGSQRGKKRECLEFDTRHYREACCRRNRNDQQALIWCFSSSRYKVIRETPS